MGQCLARSTRSRGQGRAVLMILFRHGPLEFRRKFSAVEPADHPIGGIGVHKFVRKTERADDRGMLAVLVAAALEHNVVELVAGDGERVVATSVSRAARLPRIMANPAGIEPSCNRYTILATASRNITSPHTPVRGSGQLLIAAMIGRIGRTLEVTAKYSGYARSTRAPIVWRNRKDRSESTAK